jgi:uncharacterized protein YxjI
MQYLIKEKFWSLRENFNIFTPNGDPIYTVQGKFFSWGDNLSFQDMNGNELAVIKQKLLSFKPTYEIYRNGQHFAEFKKEFSWFKQKFSLDVPGPNDYTIDGSFWQHDYWFERRNRIVATISKARWTWADTYGVEIASGEDDVAILCACIVIDQIVHDDDEND